MKTLIFVAFIVTSIAAPLSAQETDSYQGSTADDWGGFYLGGSFLALDGSQTYAGNLAPENELSGSMASGFAGFNIQKGDLVFGAEAAYALGSVRQNDDPIFQFTNMLDISARVGIGVGDALVYGLAGWSGSNWDEDGSAFLASGLNAGIGVDYQVSDRFFVGAQYLFRDLEENINSDFAAPLSSVQVRVGLRF